MPIHSPSKTSRSPSTTTQSSSSCNRSRSRSHPLSLLLDLPSSPSPHTNPSNPLQNVCFASRWRSSSQGCESRDRRSIKDKVELTTSSSSQSSLKAAGVQARFLETSAAASSLIGQLPEGGSEPVRRSYRSRDLEVSSIKGEISYRCLPPLTVSFTVQGQAL